MQATWGGRPVRLAAPERSADSPRHSTPSPARSCCSSAAAPRHARPYAMRSGTSCADAIHCRSCSTRQTCQWTPYACHAVRESTAGPYDALRLAHGANRTQARRRCVYQQGYASTNRTVAQRARGLRHAVRGWAGMCRSAPASVDLPRIRNYDIIESLCDSSGRASTGLEVAPELPGTRARAEIGSSRCGSTSTTTRASPPQHINASWF
jgi:hypothetical protein